MQLKLPTVSVWYLVALWYLSACVAVTSSRAVLKATHMPFCLSALQFIMSSALSYTLLRWVLPWTTRGNYKPVLGAMPSDSPEFKLVRSIALTYTLGFVFTNVALGLCNGQSSHSAIQPAGLSAPLSSSPSPVAALLATANSTPPPPLNQIVTHSLTHSLSSLTKIFFPTQRRSPRRSSRRSPSAR